jgi:NAD(P)H-flavin reductase
MSVSIEKLKKQIDRLKSQIHEDTKTFLEIFQRLRSAEHKLSVHEDALKDFNERFFDLLFLISPEAMAKEIKKELSAATH